MKNSQLYFIVNQTARNGKSGKIWDELELHLHAQTYEIIKTEKKGHAREIAKQIVQDCKEAATIVAVGGDGTIHEVINGAVDAPHITIAYIRAGSGNDFARGYQLPKQPEQCFELLMDLKQQQVKQYDLGYFSTGEEEGYFVNSIGAGFDALVAYKVDQSKLKYWFNKFSLGSFVYAYFLIIELFKYEPKKLHITLDGRTYVFPNTWFITICNQPYYGGGMKISPSANPENGRLNIIIAYNLPKLKFLSLFISVFWGGHTKIKNVIQLEGEKLQFSYDGEVLAHADGEKIPLPPFTVQIMPKSWRLLTKK